LDMTPEDACVRLADDLGMSPHQARDWVYHHREVAGVGRFVVLTVPGVPSGHVRSDVNLGKVHANVIVTGCDEQSSHQWSSPSPAAISLTTPSWPARAFLRRCSHHSQSTLAVDSITHHRGSPRPRGALR